MSVGSGQTVELPEGDYGKISIDQGRTVIFLGGTYNVRSISEMSTVDGPCSLCRSILFRRRRGLRVEGEFASGKSSFVGPKAGSGIEASDIVY